MNNMNKIMSLLTVMLMFILLLNNISALGVTPARTTINFEPELEKEVLLDIINSENKDLNLLIYVRGELNESIEIDQEKITMNADEESRQIKYKVKLPEEILPGLHKAEVVILQLPKESAGGEVKLESILGVASQLYVYVPYPGKYVDSKLSVYGEEEKKFIITLVSRGLKKIKEAKADIVIYDLDGEEIKKLETNKVSLLPQERKEILAEWDVDAPQGRYIAKAVLDYDGDKILFEEEFEVGEMVLDLKRIFVEDFKLGEVAKFNIIVENKWNEMIKSVYAEMRVYDENTKELADFKSATYDIPAGMQTTMFAYWDTKGLKQGLYNSNIILYYLGKKTQQDLKLDVKKDRIDIIGLGYVISEAGSSGSNLTNLLVMIIVLLVMINIIWFILLRKRFRKKKIV